MNEMQQVWIQPVMDLLEYMELYWILLLVTLRIKASSMLISVAKGSHSSLKTNKLHLAHLFLGWCMPIQMHVKSHQL